MSKKIYIASLHLKHGGVEMAITLLANALVKRGYEVEIFNTYKIGEPAYVLDERVQVKYLTNVAPNKETFKKAIQEKNIFRIMKEGFYAIRVLYLKKKTMIQKIKSIDEGTVLVTRDEQAVLLSKYGKQSVNKVAQLHHDHQFDKRLLNDFKHHYSNIDIFVVLTDLLKQEIQEYMKENKHTKITVIPNFLPNTGQKSLSEKRLKQFVAVGRLHEVKGFERLLDIWSTVIEEQDVVLKIIGDGEQYALLKNKIEALELGKNVILTGAMDHEDVLDEMSKSTGYVMTSYTEAFPYVLLEAMTSGLPVVAFDVRVGPRAIITDKQDGFLVKDGDEKTFAKRVIELVEDEDMRKKMSGNAVMKVEQFTEESIMKLWEEIL